MNSKKEGSLSIIFDPHKNMLACEIRNSIWSESETVPKPAFKRKSMGMSITRERIMYLNKGGKDKDPIDIKRTKQENVVKFDLKTEALF